MTHTRTLLSIVIALSCAAGLHAQEKKFTSARQANEVFSSAEDAATKTEAFDYVKALAGRCGAQEANEVFWMLGRMATELNKGDEFEALCHKRMTDPVPADLKNNVLFKRVEWYSLAGDEEKAFEILKTEFTDKTLGLTPQQYANIANKAAAILSGKLFRHADASALLENAMAQIKDVDPNGFATLANSQAAILRSYLADTPAAEARTREVLALGDLCSGTAYTTAAELLANIEAEKGNAENIVPALMRVLDHASVPAPGIARRIIEAGATPQQMAECVTLLRRHMVKNPTDYGGYQSRLERIQPEIVEFLIAAGKYEEAAAEARVYVLTANDKNYPAAVNLMAKALKSVDGNLGRANAFIQFQRSDNDAPAKNVMLDFPQIADDVRTKFAETLDAAGTPADWNAWLRHSVLLLWLDRPADAVEAAAKAFSVCPLNEQSMQTCASVTVRPVIVATRDTAFAQSVIDYLLYGEIKERGIANPFPAIREKLEYAK